MRWEEGLHVAHKKHKKPTSQEVFNTGLPHRERERTRERGTDHSDTKAFFGPGRVEVKVQSYTLVGS